MSLLMYFPMDKRVAKADTSAAALGSMETKNHILYCLDSRIQHPALGYLCTHGILPDSRHGVQTTKCSQYFQIFTLLFE
jgi:hypothetical protein